MASKKKDLAQIIRDNPGCVAIVDNDCWTLHKVHPDQNPHEDDEDDKEGVKYYAWEAANTLAEDGDVLPVGDGYGSGNCYGGDLLRALAKIVGIKVESV
jgi:hypothetical protein